MPKRGHAWAAGGREAIQERRAEHDALAGPIIVGMRQRGETWTAIAGYLDLSGIPSPSQARQMIEAATWTPRAAERIYARLVGKMDHRAAQARRLAQDLTAIGEHRLAAMAHEIAGDLERRKLAA